MTTVLKKETLRGWGRVRGQNTRIRLVQRGKTFVIGLTTVGVVPHDHYAWPYLGYGWPDAYLPPEAVPHTQLAEPMDWTGAGRTTVTKNALTEFDTTVWYAQHAMRYDARCHCIQCEIGGGDCLHAEPK